MSYSMRRQFGSAAASAGSWFLDQAQAGCEKAGGNFYRDVARCDCGFQKLYKNNQCVEIDTVDDFYESCRQEGGTIINKPDGPMCEVATNCRGTACGYNTNPDTWVGGSSDSGNSGGSSSGSGSKSPSGSTGSKASSGGSSAISPEDWNKYAMYGAAAVGGGILLMLLFPGLVED
jgi:hypothetical protein